MFSAVVESKYICHIYGQSGLRALHGTKCPLLTAFFLFLRTGYFSPKGVVLGFRYFAWGFDTQNNKRFLKEKKEITCAPKNFR